MADYFVAMVPGRQLITTFQQLETNRVATTIPLVNSEQLHQIGISLLKPIPEGWGVGVNFSVAKIGANDLAWQYLGQLSNQRISDFFRLGQSLEDIPSDQLGQYQLHIGIALQPLEELNQQVPVAVFDNTKVLHSARGIAEDLHRYISSFERVPNNVIDRWYDRFQKRHQHEPYFWLQDRV
jgi:hypothetical protein